MVINFRRVDMPVLIVVELAVIALCLSYVWKHIIKPAIQNRSGNPKVESELEAKVREANQKQYEKEIK